MPWYYPVISAHSNVMWAIHSWNNLQVTIIFLWYNVLQYTLICFAFRTTHAAKSIIASVLWPSNNNQDVIFMSCLIGYIIWPDISFSFLPLFFSHSVRGCEHAIIGCYCVTLRYKVTLLTILTFPFLQCFHSLLDKVQIIS